MIKRSIILLALLALALLVVPACNDNNTVVPGIRTTGSIMGLVYDVASDVPLPNATITITSVPFVTDTTGSGTIVLTVMSGSDGRFLRSDIPNGSITIGVKKDGYRTPDSQKWALTPGGTADFRFDMAPGQDPIPEFGGDEQSAWPPDYQDN